MSSEFPFVFYGDLLSGGIDPPSFDRHFDDYSGYIAKNGQEVIYGRRFPVCAISPIPASPKLSKRIIRTLREWYPNAF